MKHEIYQTNAGLGYGELAYLLKLSKDKYLCIGIKVNQSSIYEVGEIIKDEYNDLALGKTQFKLEDSTLYNKELFEYFKNNKEL